MLYISWEKTFITSQDWIRNCRIIDYYSQQLFRFKGIKFFTFKYRQKAEKLFFFYNYILEKEILKFQSQTEDHFIGNNLTSTMISMQCIFIESFLILIYAIFNLKLTKEATISGHDGLAFTNIKIEKKLWLNYQIKVSSYSKSSKTWKIRKDFPIKATFTILDDIQLKQLIAKKNNIIFEKLIKLCSVKTIRKNYKGSFNIQAWRAIKTFKYTRYYYIPSLRDRLLQKIIYFSTYYIFKYQSASAFFLFQIKKFGWNIILIIINNFINLNYELKSFLGFPKKLTFLEFKIYKEPKYKFWKPKVGLKNYVRLFSYYYNYWGLQKIDKKKKSKKNFIFYEYIKIIKLEVTFFILNRIYQLLLNTFPLAEKYKFFLKVWFDFIIKKNSETLNFFLINNKIFQKSSFEIYIHNTLLDTFESYLLQNNIWVFRKLEKTYTFKGNWQKELKIIRYGGNVLLFGKDLGIQFIQTSVRLSIFLRVRGSYLKKNYTSSYYSIFKPGSSFEYFGFVFTFIWSKSSCFYRGKYTTPCLNPFFILYNKFYYIQNGLSIKITKKIYDKILYKLKSLLSFFNITFSINLLFKKINTFLLNEIFIFICTDSILHQFKCLDKIIYKKIWDLLNKKFKSKPKKFLYLKFKFSLKTFFIFGKYKLLRLRDIKKITNKLIYTFIY